MKPKKNWLQVQKKLDIINQLHKLTSSNKLMEFMAEEYIEEFTYTASEYLSLLTMGQFELVYDNGFLIKDHFCGGQLRKVNTVPGRRGCFWFRFGYLLICARFHRLEARRRLSFCL